MADYDSYTAPKNVPMLKQDMAPRVLQAGDDDVGQPYVLLTDKDIRISAGAKNGFSIDEPFGITMQGPISLSESPENISLAGGYWRINPMVLTGVASSAATPVPWLVDSKPLLTKEASSMSDVLGGAMDGGMSI